MKNKLFLLPVLFIFSVQVNGQTPRVVIEEDYTNPNRRMYVAGDEYHERYIQDGMYISKAGKLPASLDFGFRFDPYNNPQEKNKATEASDMGFTIVKIKGNKESFISVGINYIYLKLCFNELGQWKLTNYYEDKVYQQGTIKINPGANQILFSHRGDRLRCYINENEIVQYTFDKEQSWGNFMRWENLQIFTKDKKMVIALDKVVLKGYPAYTKYPEEIAMAKEAEEIKIQAEKVIRDSLIREKLKQQLKFSEGLAAIEIKEKWGFIDSTGKEIVSFKYDYAENFNSGLAMVRTGKYPDYTHGFIDKQGKEIIPLIYDKVGKFSEGLISVSIKDKFGFIDETGKEIIPLKYGGTWDFREGLAMVRNGRYGIGKCGFIDKTGKEVIPLKYEQGDEGFKEGMALVVLDGKYGFIDKTGNEIILPKYQYAFSFKQGLAVVNLDSKWGLIDTKGNVKIPLIYDNAGDGICDGLVLLAKEKKWGYVDKTGKEIIPFKYNKANNFFEGLAAVCLDNKYGFINKTGKVIVPLIYDEASNMLNGRLRVKLKDKYLEFDKNGLEIK